MDEKFNDYLKEREAVNQHALLVLLEMAVDSEGLSRVLEILSNICAEKAEHVRCNWQDETTAKVWDKYAKKLLKVT